MRNDYRRLGRMVENQLNERRRKWLAERLAADGIDATNLSRQIGKSPGFVRDFLSGRKQSMSADAWDALERQLGSLSLAAIDPTQVTAAFEVLLQLYLDSDLAAREGAQALLTVITAPQSLPPGVTRDAATRLLVHQIVTQLSQQGIGNKR